DGLGKDFGPANVVIVAVHAGHDGVFQAERGYSLCYSARLVPVDGLRPSLGHGTKTAAARADITQQHEGGGAMIPALADIRTLGRFANCMQSQTASQFLEIVKVVADGSFGAQPIRLG